MNEQRWWAAGSPWKRMNGNGGPLARRRCIGNSGERGRRIEVNGEGSRLVKGDGVVSGLGRREPACRKT